MTSALALRRHGGWRRELVLFVAAYVAYSIARGAAGGSVDVGLENARAIIALQARLGIGVEGAIQEHLIGQPVMWLLNRLYLIAQFAVVPVALVWLWRRHPHRYPVLRTTVLATWLLALPIYAAFPTAPPRLAGIGMVDTVSEQTRFALDSPLVTAFYNPVAAVPSLHAGFAIAVGVAVATTARSPWARAAALLWGPTVALVVIATGNHFILDVVFGAIAVLAGYAVARFVHRDRPTARRRRARAAAIASGVPMRVALLCPYDWHRPGGVRTHVAGLADSLRARGHDVDVIAAGRRSGPADGVLRVGGTTPMKINGSIARIAITPIATWRVWRALRTGGYDVVHLHEPIIPMVCWTALWLRRAALTATFHAYHPTGRPYRIARPLFGGLVGRVPAPIAVSAAARACAARITRRQVTVIPNGISPSVPNEADTRREGGRRILYVGRNDPRKGLAILADAMPRLEDDIRLDVVGVTADELGGADLPAAALQRMDVHGRVGEGERLALLRRADVVCAPSISGESFGLVLAEATAHGVPVVASDITGYREVLPPGFGILVPPGDPLQLAGALEAALGDAALRERVRMHGADAVAALHWDRVSGLVERQYRAAVVAHADGLAEPAVVGVAVPPADVAAD